MFCPNCKGKLVLTDSELLSQDLQGGDYYTHQCESCKTYWHLHIHGDGIDLISTKHNQTVASNKIINDLKIELSERVFWLER